MIPELYEDGLVTVPESGESYNYLIMEYVPKSLEELCLEES